VLLGCEKDALNYQLNTSMKQENDVKSGRIKCKFTSGNKEKQVNGEKIGTQKIALPQFV
jgi:hypothetical protein